MIIHVHGPINAGKTTVCQHLAAKLPNSVFFDSDYLADREKYETLEAWIESVISKMKTAGDLAKRSGRDYVIFSYPLREEDHATLKAHFGEKFRCVALAPPLHECVKDRGERQLEDWEVDRIYEMYQEGFQRPSFSDFTLNNFGQAPEETTEIILSWLMRESEQREASTG